MMLQSTLKSGAVEDSSPAALIKEIENQSHIAKEENARLLQEKKDVDTRLQAIEKENVHLNDEVIRLEKAEVENTHLVQEKRDLNRKLQDVEKEKPDLFDKISFLEAARDEKKCAIASNNDELKHSFAIEKEKLQVELEKEKEKVKEQNQKIQNSQKQSEKLRADIMSAQDDFRHLQKEKESAEAKHEMGRREHQNLPTVDLLSNLGLLPRPLRALETYKTALQVTTVKSIN